MSKRLLTTKWDDSTSAFLSVAYTIENNCMSPSSLDDVFESFIQLTNTLDISHEELINAYKSKHKKNIERLVNNY